MKNEQLYTENTAIEPGYIQCEGRRRVRVVIRETEYMGWGFGYSGRELNLGGGIREAFSEYAAYGDDDPYAA